MPLESAGQPPIGADSPPPLHASAACVPSPRRLPGFAVKHCLLLWKDRIILIRVMWMMPSLIKVMEVIMTGIITQLAMEAIISIAV